MSHSLSNLSISKLIRFEPSSSEGLGGSPPAVIIDKFSTLVFLIIPNKFSIYGEQILGEDEYDDFIPKLQTALELRGVSYVDVYDAFKNYQREHPNELLYYAGDTHYLPVGKKILIDELINAGIGLDSKVIE